MAFLRRFASNWSAVQGFGSSRTKSELVILVTPSIIDDESGGSYGMDTSRVLRQVAI